MNTRSRFLFTLLWVSIAIVLTFAAAVFVPINELSKGWQIAGGAIVGAVAVIAVRVIRHNLTK